MAYDNGLDEFGGYGGVPDPIIADSDPTKPQKPRQKSFGQRYSDSLRGGHGLAGAAINAGLSYLNNPSSAAQSQQDDGGGSAKKGLLLKIAGLKSGGHVLGPMPALVGEAGPEAIMHSDAPPELVTKPKIEMLGANGPDEVVPLTKGPHRTSNLGRKFIKSHGLGGKTGKIGSFKGGKVHRFASGGIVDPFDPYDPYYEEDPNAPPKLGAPLETPPPLPLPKAPEAAAPEMPDVSQAPPPLPGASMPAPGAPPPSELDQLRAKRAALNAPVAPTPSIKRQLAAAALSAVPIINRSGIPQEVLRPGYAAQVAQYNASKADLDKQVALQDEAFNQNLRQEQLASVKEGRKSAEAARQATANDQLERLYKDARDKGGEEVPAGTQLRPDEVGRYNVVPVGQKVFKIPTLAEHARLIRAPQAVRTYEQHLVAIVENPDSTPEAKATAEAELQSIKEKPGRQLGDESRIAARAAGVDPNKSPDEWTPDEAAKVEKEIAKQRQAMHVSVAMPGATPSDPKDIADAIIRGDQPPTLQGLYRYGSPVRAELARRGFDLATHQRDWQAISHYLSTLNGQTQQRLRQAVQFTYDSLDQIEDLYNQWQKLGPASGFKVLNRGALEAAKQLPGPAGSVAQNLQAQINDLVSELGTVYKGGTASTDESLRLAMENLKADWNEDTFRRALSQIRRNLTIRRNSYMTATPAGVSPDSPYMPPHEGVSGTTTGASPAGGGAPAPASAPQGGYVRYAKAANGHQIGQKPDGGWYDVQTGKRIQ